MIELSRRQLVGSAALALVGAGVAGPRTSRASTVSIDEALRGAAGIGRVPGVVAMAANEKGVLYEGAFGRREIAGGPDLALDSVFWIASMTKAVTSAAAMQLVEQGRLRLDEPVAAILPELASPQVLEGFDAQGAAILRPAAGPITLRRLLTHTAGFGYDIWNADLGRYMEQAGIPAIATCRNAALMTPLVAEPGTRWNYGINIDWAGKMVERVSGQSLEAYFREHIFGPLGMRDTGFRIGAEQRQRLVSMHARQADGSLTAIPFEMPQDPEFFMGGGGLYSTAPDYLRFAQAFLHDGRLDGVQILRPETVALMAENQIGDIEVTMLETVQPDASNDAEFFPGMTKRWGLGFMITTEEAPTGRSAGSLAWAGLGNTYFWIDRRRRVTGVILTQLLPFADRQSLALLDAFESGTYRVLRGA